MEKFKKLGRDEMKMITGGGEAIATEQSCGGGRCSIDTDCSGDCYTCQGGTATGGRDGTCSEKLAA